MEKVNKDKKEEEQGGDEKNDKSDIFRFSSGKGWFFRRGDLHRRS